LVNILNTELHKINSWLVRNRLSLNVNKTFAMLFSNRRVANTDSRIEIGGGVVEFADVGRYLGVMLDSNLSYKDHINYVYTKVSKSVGILYKLSSNVPKDVFMSLYYSFIYPYLTYCVVVWGGAADVHVDRLLMLQKRAVRIITNNSYLDHCNPLFHSTGMLKIKDLYNYLCSIYAFKNVDSFDRVEHMYDTRNKYNLVPEFQRLATTQRSLSFVGQKLLNELPLDIKNSNSLPIFKAKLRTQLLSGYVRSEGV
jgi:hypothetical protein